MKFYVAIKYEFSTGGRPSANQMYSYQVNLPCTAMLETDEEVHLFFLPLRSSLKMLRSFRDSGPIRLTVDIFISRIKKDRTKNVTHFGVF